MSTPTDSPGGDNARESLHSGVSDLDWGAVRGALQRIDGGPHA